MGASPSNGTPLFRFSGRFIPISRPTPINAGRGALRRPQRLCERCVLCDPQYLITGAMTLSEMAVLAMDEILLRTEISGRGEEGARRRAFERGPARVRPRQARPSRMTPRDFTSERARRGYGRDKRGPPARRRATSLRNGPGAGTAATSAALPHDAARLRFGTGRGAGTAATSAALPHDAARLHFGTGRGAGTAATSAALPHDAARRHTAAPPQDEISLRNKS